MTAIEDSNFRSSQSNNVFPEHLFLVESPLPSAKSERRLRNENGGKVEKNLANQIMHLQSNLFPVPRLRRLRGTGGPGNEIV